MTKPKGENDDRKEVDVVIKGIQEVKGNNIVHLDLRDIPNAVSDHFIICHGESVTQVDAISESIEEKLKTEVRIRAHHVEGRQNSQWILLDFFDILVHVFQEEYRSFFKLEELWADGNVMRVD